MSHLPVLLEATGAVLCGAAGVLGYAVRNPAATLLAPSIHQGVATRRAIALTFDDGPSESTPELLELLASHGVHGTFFQCGANVRRLPGIARQVLAAGHEIGNHTETHPELYFKSPDFIYRELAAAQQSIEQTVGVRPRIFRPPFGVRWFGMGAAQRRLDLMGVMWSTMAVDWKWPAERVLPHLLKGARNGAIFCLHDGRTLQANPDINSTLGALRELLPELIGRGFHFEKVTDIVCPTKS